MVVNSTLQSTRLIRIGKNKSSSEYSHIFDSRKKLLAPRIRLKFQCRVETLIWRLWWNFRGKARFDLSVQAFFNRLRVLRGFPVSLLWQEAIKLIGRYQQVIRFGFLSERTTDQDGKPEHNLNCLYQADKTVHSRPSLKSELFRLN